MNANSYFEIGHSHLVCEDYALSEQSCGSTFIIVSDGCSESNNTDVGARLVTIIARDTLIHLINSNFLKQDKAIETFPIVFQQLFLKKCLETKAVLNLSVNTFDATLLLSFVLDDQLFVLCYGDGHIIYKTKAGLTIADSIEYQSGAPYYLSYQMDNAKKEAYFNEFKESLIDEGSVTIKADGSSNSRIFNQKLLTEHSNMFSYWKVFDIKNQELSSISLSSDGIGTYSKSQKSDSEIKLDSSLPEMIRRMVAYKGTNGDFVVRRMNRMRLNMTEGGIIHDDDVSCATIIF